MAVRRKNYSDKHTEGTQQDFGLSVHLPGEIYLARIKASEMELAKTSFEWFRGTDANGDPLWGNLSQKAAVFSDPNGIGWSIGAHYNSGLNRYILTTEHNTSRVGSLGIFDAPEPWGPWTTVKYWSPTDYFGKTRTGDLLAWENNVFFIDFATKWISDDGINFTLNYTGAGGGKNNDSFNTLLGNFVLAGDINGDGKVNVADVLLATGMALGLVTPTTQQLLRGDIAPVVAGVSVPDGKITVGDLIRIQRVALRL